MNTPFDNMFGKVVQDVNVPEGTVYLIGMRYKPVVLAPSQSLSDLSLEEQLKQGIDWDATAKASAVFTNIGK